MQNKLKMIVVLAFTVLVVLAACDNPMSAEEAKDFFKGTWKNTDKESATLTLNLYPDDTYSFNVVGGPSNGQVRTGAWKCTQYYLYLTIDSNEIIIGYAVPKNSGKNQWLITLRGTGLPDYFGTEFNRFL